MADNGNNNPEAQVESTSKGKADYASSFPSLGAPAPAAAGNNKSSWMKKKKGPGSMSLINNKKAAQKAGAKQNNSIMKTVTIPRDDRKVKNDVYGQKEMRSNCSSVSQKTGTKISYRKVEK